MFHQSSPNVSSSGVNQVDHIAEATPQPLPARASCFSIAARKLCTPVLTAILLASGAAGVLPALKARGQQATRMSKQDFAKYLPPGNSPIRSASGVMIHNAGSDVGRSDTSVFLSNQHQPTVAILDSLPALGAQMDPYKLNGEWYVRHQAGDGSPPLRLADEFAQINDWLDKNPDRIFVLDMDLHKRIGDTDSSLADLIKGSFGSKLLIKASDLEVEDFVFRRGNSFTVADALAADKRVILSDRSAKIAGLTEIVQRQVTVSFTTTHASNLTPAYSFARGFPFVDNTSFESTSGMQPDHFETPQEILAHVKVPSTQVLLDQMNLASFVEPRGFESDPVFISGYPESEIGRNATLGATTAAAVVGGFAALAVAALAAHSIRKQSVELRQGTVENNVHARQSLSWIAGLTTVQLTSALSNCALTLATVFPGLRQQFGVGGLVAVSAGLVAMLATTRINQPALNKTGHDDLEQQVIQPPVVRALTGREYSSIARLAEGATAYHVLTRFASLAKYKIPATLPALGVLNVLLAAQAGAMKVKIHNINAQQALRNNPENMVAVANKLQNDIRRQGWKSGFAMAGMIGSLGIVMPAMSGPLMGAAALTPIASRVGAACFARMKARQLNA